MRKRYTAFISYAAPDKELAKYIKTLFEFMRHEVYFAPVALREEAGKEWRSKVIEGMKQSYSIIPIYTRNSIKRPWVLYELGVADALGLDKFPARVSEISPAETNLPGKDVQIFKLFDKNDLIDLFTNACNLKNNPSNEELEKIKVKQNVTMLLEKLSETNKIIENSSTRWVFVAGSPPMNTVEKEHDETKDEFFNKVKMFLPRLTEVLLESGFSIASCPQVEYVGKIVCQEAISWITKNDQQKKRYKIAGIYPIDRDLRKLDIDESFKLTWKDNLLDFRKSYMEKQEWLIIVGGNEGTNEEYMAAIDKNVKIFPIPCFGGTGFKLWENNEKLRLSPCVECNEKNGRCSSETIKKIAEKLEKTA